MSFSGFQYSLENKRLETPWEIWFFHTSSLGGGFNFFLPDPWGFHDPIWCAHIFEMSDETFNHQPPPNVPPPRNKGLRSWETIGFHKPLRPYIWGGACYICFFKLLVVRFYKIFCASHRWVHNWYILGSYPPPRMQSSPPGWHNICSRESRPKPAFATVTGRGDNPKYISYPSESSLKIRFHKRW